MQEAGRGRQWGQQLPGFRAGASSWPPPQSLSDKQAAFPAAPKAEPPGGERIAQESPGLPGSLLAGAGRHLVATLGTAGPGQAQPPLLQLTERAMPPCLLPSDPTRPRPRHSPDCRRAEGSAGCGSARCRPRRNSWCRHPRPSALQRPPAGPGASRTGRGLRGQEGVAVFFSSLTVGLASTSPHLPGPHLGISHSTCQPPVPSPSHGGRRGPGTPRGGNPRGPAEDRCHCSRDFQQGLESLASHFWGSSGSGARAAAPSLSAPAPGEHPLQVQVGMPLPPCPEGAPFSNYFGDPILSCPETPPFIHLSVFHLPPSHPQLTRQVQVIQALLGSCQLSPSATLRPSTSTTHSEEEEMGMGEHRYSSCVSSPSMPGAGPTPSS